MDKDVLTKSEYYAERIKEVEYNYINSLNNPDDISKVAVFNGLISQIYVQVFKPDRRTKEYKDNNYNNLNNSILDYDDTELINNLWEIYKYLCSKYNIIPIMLQFCSMVGISKDTLYTWLRGDRREASKAHLSLAKNIHDDCEGVILSNVANNNSVGSIFLSKAVYGYNEGNTLTIQTSDREPPGLSEKELMAIVDERAELDALPD